MSELIKIAYKNFEKDYDLYQFLKNSNHENVEIEFGVDIINNIKEEGYCDQENCPFNGYWAGFITTHNLTETSVILKRKNLNEFVLELNNLIFNTTNTKESEIDITEAVQELRAKFSYVTDSEFNTVIKVGFRNLLSKGIRFKGFNYKLRFENDHIFIIKTLDYNYAIEFFSCRNTPRIRIFEINKDSAQSLGSITKDNCTPICECRYKEYADTFINLNIKERDVFVLDSSEINTFYGFGDNYFTKLTGPMINKWWDEDCYDNLVKYSINSENGDNDFGLCFITWQDTLVETSFYNNYISDDITQEEFEMICKDRMYTSIAESIRHVINSRGITKEDKLIIEAKLTSLENSIQEVINSNKKDIVLNTAKKVLSDSPEYLETCSFEKLCELLRNLNTGLDCGFLYFRFSDNDLDELFAKAVALKIRGLSLNIDIPIFVQSTMIKGVMANEIIELVKDKLDIGLYSWTILD